MSRCCIHGRLATSTAGLPTETQRPGARDSSPRTSDFLPVPAFVSARFKPLPLSISWRIRDRAIFSPSSTSYTAALCFRPLSRTMLQKGELVRHPPKESRTGCLRYSSYS